MPVRALRPTFTKTKNPQAKRLKTMNAREGIKTHIISALVNHAMIQ